MKISLGLHIGRPRHGPSPPPPADTTAPTFVSAVVSNSTPTKIVLTYSETLSATLTGSITVNGGKTVTSQTRVGSTVEVVVNSAYVYGDTITISVPSGCVKDVAGNSATALTNQSVTNNMAQVGDTTAPTLSSAIVSNATPTQVVLTYNEALNASSVPATSAFTISGKTISNVAVSGSTVTVTVSVAFVYGDTIAISYTAGANPIEDSAGNNAGNLSNQSVTNNVAFVDTTAPTLSTAVVANATPTLVVLTYNEALNASSVPATSAYTIAGKTITNVAVSGSTVTLTVSAAFAFGDTIAVSYTAGANPVEDSAGNNAANLSSQAVTNNIQEETDISTDFDAYYDPEFALLESTANRTYSLVSKPAKTTTLATAGYTDAQYDTRVYRLTNASTDGNGGQRLRHEYSRRNPFNCDSTRYIAQTTDGFWFIFNANTFAKVSQSGSNGSVPGMVGDCEAFWHPTEANKIWFTEQNGGMTYSEYNTTTGATSTLFTLTGKLPSGFGSTGRCSTLSEGRPSNDGRYWALACRTTGFSYIGTVVYDRTADACVGWALGGNTPNNISISPLGNYVVFGADFSGAGGATSGNYVMPRTAQSASGYIPVSTLAFSNPQHMDCALGLNGEEYLVYGAYDEDSGYIRAYNMSTDTSFRLPVTLYPTAGEATAFHISGVLSEKNPGKVIVSTYKSYEDYMNIMPSTTVRYMYDHIFAVELATDGRVMHIAEHHSSGGTYFNEPQATSNSDGTRIVWASAYNGRSGTDTEWTESFMAGLPSWALAAADAGATRLTSPTISGTATVGNTLTRTLGTYSGTPTPTVSGIWQLSTNGGSSYSDSTGYTGATSPVLATNGDMVRWAETGSNTGGTTSVGYSNVITVAALAAPVNTVAPAIASTGSSSSVTTGDDGPWTGNPAPTYAYVWQRNISTVWTDSAFTTKNATLTPVGEWRLKVTATNSQGNASATSNTTTISAAAGWVQGVGPTVGTTTTTQALSSSTPVGRLVVVTVAQKYGANPPRDISSVYDSVDGIGSPYTLAHSEVNGSGNLRIDTYSRVVTSAGTRTISSVLASAGDQTITVNEYSGVTTLGAVNGAGGTGTSAAPGSITPSGTALYINTVATTDSYMDVTPDAAYTERQEIEFGGVTINTHDRVTSGAQNPATTISSSVEWCAVIISFT